MSTTVYFYFSFPTTYKSGTYKTVATTTHPCSSDIEAACTASNLYSNWEIGGATCSFLERCLDGTRCCNAACPIDGCNKTCKQTNATGIGCKGYNPGACGCSGNFGSHPTYRNCSYNCYTPPTDTFCHPGAASVVYISGRKDISTSASLYYVFKATYNTSLFTTPQQLATLENNLNTNKEGLSTDQIASNTDNLNILKRQVCTASNLQTTPCTEFCKVNRVTGQLPTTNCESAWNTFCAYQGNIATAECDTWCGPTTANDMTSTCKNLYMTHCNSPDKFSSSVCRDFYKSQYISDQLSDNVHTLLTSQCSKYVDSSGNVIDSTGAAVVPGTTTIDKYPATTCACFLPSNVYSTFYDSITKSYPEFKNYLTNNQCSYPDCANSGAIQPQKNITCPNVSITSCIINSTIGGSVTNSNLNIVNKCASDIKETGTYTNKGLNVAPPEEKQFDAVATLPPITPAPPKEEEEPTTPEPSSEQEPTLLQVYSNAIQHENPIIRFLAIVFSVFSVFAGVVIVLVLKKILFGAKPKTQQQQQIPLVYQ